MPKVSKNEQLLTTSELQRATGYGAAHIGDMKANGIITPASHGKWPALATLGAIIRRLRERDAGTEDRQRKNKAEADTAELAALRERGTVMPKDVVLAWLADERTEIRRLIERSPDLATAQKNKLLATFSKMKPKSLE